VHPGKIAKVISEVITMADMFAPLVAQLKANPKTIVFTEGNDPRILEAASKLLAEGVLKVVMVGNEAECKAAAAAELKVASTEIAKACSKGVYHKNNAARKVSRLATLVNSMN
jgi:ribosomal protein S20